jgi:hypothetical protein
MSVDAYTQMELVMVPEVEEVKAPLKTVVFVKQD